MIWGKKIDYAPWNRESYVLTSLSGFLHLIVWRQSRQMVFTFIPHLILNLVPIFWTNYSIIPYLFRFIG